MQMTGFLNTVDLTYVSIRQCDGALCAQYTLNGLKLG